MEGKKVSEAGWFWHRVMKSGRRANSAGNIHGGSIMKLIDTAAAVAALRAGERCHRFH